jgi:hypothetical protein
MGFKNPDWWLALGTRAPRRLSVRNENNVSLPIASLTIASLELMPGFIEGTHVPRHNPHSFHESKP